VQVGHIPRAVAAEMAWLMDEKLISVEGRMIGQNLDGAKHYKLAMDMSIYARPSLREVLEPELVWATPGQRGFEAMRQGLTQGGGPPKGKGKARGGDTGVAGPGNSGVGLPQAVDPEMQKLLDGLKKVGEDEKQADNVMVSVIFGVY
jgi:SWI/SNF-related matrix-associated actin-dependent regulator of chromatin subfamily A3